MAKAKIVGRFEKVDGFKNPNRVPSEARNLMSGGQPGTCYYLGQSFPPGSHITYDGREYVCSDGSWQPA